MSLTPRDVELYRLDHFYTQIFLPTILGERIPSRINIIDDKLYLADSVGYFEIEYGKFNNGINNMEDFMKRYKCFLTEEEVHNDNNL